MARIDPGRLRAAVFALLHCLFASAWLQLACQLRPAGSNSPASCVRGSSGCWRGGEQLRSCQQVDGCMFGCSIGLLRQRVTYLQKE